MIKGSVPNLMPEGLTQHERDHLVKLWHIENNSKKLEPRAQAKLLISMCVDYTVLNLEDQLYPIMIKINNICPEYFSKYLAEDMKADESFRYAFQFIQRTIKSFQSNGNG